jgi:RNA-directed DNA polymerase
MTRKHSISNEKQFEDIVSVEQLFLAWEMFRRGKRQREDVQIFERHLEERIFDLHRDLADGSYQHGKYESFFIEDPKQRNIHKATVRDRIVHQVVYLELERIYQNKFISQSYSSRVGMGTHAAINATRVALRKESGNYTVECWALKCDVRRFYDSIEHGVLFGVLERRVKEPRFMGLLREIVGSFTIGAETGVGIPIGNLTSQIFTNILLDRLDTYVKERLRVRYYFRYADDCLLVSRDRRYLESAFTRMKEFLSDELGLHFHPKKWFIRPLHQGIDFLGVVLLPYHTALRAKTRRRMFKKLHAGFQKLESGQITTEKFDSTKSSYRGLLCHLNAHKLNEKMENHFCKLTPQQNGTLRHKHPITLPEYTFDGARL